MTPLPIAAPVLPSNAQLQAISKSSGPADNADTKSFAHLLKAHDHDDADGTAEKANAPAHRSPSAVESKQKEPRRKGTNGALLSLYTSVPQQQTLDSRSLLLSLPMTAKQDDDEKGKTSHAAVAIPQSSTPDKSGMQASTPIAFGVTISGAPAQYAKQAGVATESQDAASQAAQGQTPAALQHSAPTPLPKLSASPEQSPSAARAKTSDTALAGIANSIQKPHLQTASNGSQQQHSQHASKEKDTATSAGTASSRTAAVAHESASTASGSQSGATVKVDAAVLGASVPAQPSQTLAEPALGRAAGPSAMPSAAQAAAVAEPPATPVVRPHAIDLKVGEPGNGQVDLRISQRAGDVQVTVRTPDANLAQSLRQHLPELSDRLSQSGIHGDVWQPALAQASSSDSNGQSDSGGAGQWQREQPDGQRRQQQPNSEQEQGQPEASWLNTFITADKEAR